MPLDKNISREEFDRRLDAANERQRIENEKKQRELQDIEQLTAHYNALLAELQIRTEQPAPTSITDERSNVRYQLLRLAGETLSLAASL